MGMFDYLKCHYPLPIEGLNDLQFQTKHTNAQFMDNYEIREDGSWWHEEYNIEDHSDPTKDGFGRLYGCMTKVNKRWVQEIITGEIRFYTVHNNKWLDFSAYFVEGKLNSIYLIKWEDVND